MSRTIRGRRRRSGLPLRSAAICSGRSRRTSTRLSADIFGYNAVQLGLPHATCCVRAASRFSASGPLGAGCAQDRLPRSADASNSIDLVVLPHVLEFNHNHTRSCARWRGCSFRKAKLVLPASIPGVCGASTCLRRKAAIRGTAALSISEAQGRLTLLELEITGGQMAVMRRRALPEKWLQRCAFMDPAGDRWWPIAGGVYFLQR